MSRCLASFSEQLVLALRVRSEPSAVQLDYDVELVERTRPGIFRSAHAMLLEVADVTSKDCSAFLGRVELLPVRECDPLKEFRQLGGFCSEDAVRRVWDWARLAEHHSAALLRKFLPHRWELQAGAVLSAEQRRLADQISSWLQTQEGAGADC